MSEVWLLLLVLAMVAAVLAVGRTRAAAAPGDAALDRYFVEETRRLASQSPPPIAPLESWPQRREELRRQLWEMLGLWPQPPREDLRPEVTGTVETPDFRVGRLHFQPRPGLYVTGNLYLPTAVGEGTERCPAVLYLSGHAPNRKDGVSFGAKASYHHHGVWLARNGFVCLVLDTVELGEIEGNHHGTYRDGLWWWNSRGYTPAGLEVWSAVRALDYLQSRPEVDGERLGVTGRSGGGAYSWYLAALDDRVECAVPVAGMTDLQDQVVGGCVSDHCDCMFFLNTHGWDFPHVGALIAPRPLLIGNTDRDTLFPLDGVVRLHDRIRAVYREMGAEESLGLLVAPGRHTDTPDLHLGTLRWLRQHLKVDGPLVETASDRVLEPEQLRVFERLPAGETNTRAAEVFVPRAPTPPVPADPEEWAALREQWTAGLREQCFRRWPEEGAAPRPSLIASAESDGLRLSVYEWESQPGVDLRLYLLRRAGTARIDRVTLSVLAEDDWERWLGELAGPFRSALADELAATRPAAVGPEGGRVPKDRLSEGAALAWLAPRGVGLTAWERSEPRHTHIRRRFMLLGQTLDGMRVWDIRRALQALRSLEETRGAGVRLEAEGAAAANVLYASLFEEGIDGLVLRRLPSSHLEGPDYLNVLRVLDIPQAVALAAGARPVVLEDCGPEAAGYAEAVGRALVWGEGRGVHASAGAGPSGVR